MTDPVADLLTRIRNGCKAQKPSVSLPSSKLKKEIVRILMEQNYIRDYTETPDNKQNVLRVRLKYNAGDVPVIRGIQRVSTPGLRQYQGVEEVRLSTHGQTGCAVLSTSAGVMTNFEAATRKIGGEVLLRCW
jgi:small subunit ribosomal protein S8